MITFRGVPAVAMVAALAVPGLASEPSTPHALRPVLELPKAVFTDGEPVFFWAGLRSEEAMSQEEYEPCTVEIVDPELRVTTQQLPWPTDGDGRFGWKGGAGLSGDDTFPGTYRARVTCGEETVEEIFRVLALDPGSQLEARFELDRGCGGDPTDRRLTLVLANHGDHLIQVAIPGALLGGWLSFGARWEDPPASCHAFFPPEALGLEPPQEGDVLHEELAYDVLSEVAHWTLSPGERRREAFCLSWGLASCSSRRVPTFLRVSGTLQLLVGPEDGPFERLAPIRRTVRAELEPASR